MVWTISQELQKPSNTRRETRAKERRTKPKKTTVSQYIENRSQGKFMLRVHSCIKNIKFSERWGLTLGSVGSSASSCKASQLCRYVVAQRVVYGFRFCWYLFLRSWKLRSWLTCLSTRLQRHLRRRPGKYSTL